MSLLYGIIILPTQQIHYHHQNHHTFASIEFPAPKGVIQWSLHSLIPKCCDFFKSTCFIDIWQSKLMTIRQCPAFLRIYVTSTGFAVSWEAKYGYYHTHLVDTMNSQHSRNKHDPSLPNTFWVGVWTHKYLLRRPLGGPNTYSQGMSRMLED